MVYYAGMYGNSALLQHHGILGMKWGVRRYQNKDGTLTSAGKKRYGYAEKVEERNQKAVAKVKKDAAEYVSGFEKETARLDAKAKARPTRGNLAKAERAHREEVRAKGLANSVIAAKQQKAEQNVKAAQKTEQRIISKSQTSKHYQSLVEKYKSEGMTKEDAEKAAAKRIDTEKKVIIGVGAAAVAALATTVAVKNWDSRYAKALVDSTPEGELDNVLKNASKRTKKAVEKYSQTMNSPLGAKKVREYASAGIDYLQDRDLDLSATPLHRITRNGDFSAGLAKPFYAAYDKTDRMKYRGLYANQLLQGGARKIFDVEIKPKKNIKVAGDDTVKTAIRDILKSKDGRTFLEDAMQANSACAGNPFLRFLAPERAAAHDAAHAQFKKLFASSDLSTAVDKMSASELDSIFKAINVNLSGGGGKVGGRLYSTLRSMGYQAINDINDRIFSGYKAKDPLIVIDPSGVVGEVNGRQLGLMEINKALKEAQRAILH